MKKAKIIIVDIDGTICSLENGDYVNAKPLRSRIKKINDLYNKGNKIIFHTARGTVTGYDWRDITEAQLKKWKAKHHDLIFKKPFGDVYVGDNYENADDFFKLK